MEIALPPKLLNSVYTAFNAFTAYTASTLTVINAHGIWQFDRKTKWKYEKLYINIILLYFKDNDKISCAIS